MTEENLESPLAEVRSDLVKFEDLLYKVIRGTYDPPYFPQDWADRMVAEDQLINMRLVEDFFDRYLEKKTDTIDRLPALTYRLMDIKMQAYFVTKAMPGLHNALFFKSGLDLRDPMSRPGLYADHLCMMQALIGQVRILWDRIMAFVYFFEEGRDPAKSIRTRFFNKLPEWSNRWDAFASCESVIDTYDASFRTPEFHKNSILRASVTRDEPIDPNEIRGPLADAVSRFWQVLIANVEGVTPTVDKICPDLGADGPEPPQP